MKAYVMRLWSRIFRMDKTQASIFCLLQRHSLSAKAQAQAWKTGAGGRNIWVTLSGKADTLPKGCQEVLSDLLRWLSRVGKMDSRRIKSSWPRNYKTPRGEHRQNTLYFLSLMLSISLFPFGFFPLVSFPFLREKKITNFPISSNYHSISFSQVSW